MGPQILGRHSIKGEQTNKSKKTATWILDILEIIHTDICCLDAYVPSQKYFITSFMITHNICMCSCFITSMKL